MDAKDKIAMVKDRAAFGSNVEDLKDTVENCDAKG